jgi:glycosyltransferase involved in cell wall biosynthesis
MKGKTFAVVYQYTRHLSQGGGERRLYEIYSRLGVNVDWFYQSGNQVTTTENITYVPLSNRFFKKRSLIETAFWAWQMLRIPAASYKIVHAGQMPFFNVAVLMLKIMFNKRFLGAETKLIIDYWEYWGSEWNKFSFPLSFCGKVLEKWILRNATDIVVISEKTLKDVFPHTRAKIVLIHNGFDPVPTKTANAKQGYDFIYFGRLQAHKRVALSLKVFAMLLSFEPSYRMAVVGNGAEIDDLKNLADELSISGSVFFFDDVSRTDDLFGYLKSAKAMLFFGSQEGGGSIALFEANACGLPVVHVRETNGIDPSFFEQGGNILFDEFDAGKIANSLFHLLRDKKAWRCRREKCKDMVRDKTWEDAAEKYKSILLG